MKEITESIDRIDLRILDCMQKNGRISNLKLAEAVALSPTAVLARVQRLTKEGYILGYEARLNPLKLGAGMLVFVEVLLDRTNHNVFEQFKAAVQVRDEIEQLQSCENVYVLFTEVIVDHSAVSSQKVKGHRVIVLHTL